MYVFIQCKNFNAHYHIITILVEASRLTWICDTADIITTVRNIEVSELSTDYCWHSYKISFWKQYTFSLASELEYKTHIWELRYVHNNIVSNI